MITKHSLNGRWQWRACGETEYREGIVPGSVLSDMLRLNLIEDPYWRCNEYAVRELMAQDYCYRRTFVVDAAELHHDRAELVCEGLDTIADLRLNGHFVAHTDDMHRTYRFPVDKLLREGENEIEILFSSPLQFVREEDARNDIHYASTGCLRGNAALRKAHYMFGWDWGPQLPDAGIFRDIRLEYTDTARLEDVRIRQEHLVEGVRLVFQTRAVLPTDGSYLVDACVTAPDGQTFTVRSAWGEPLSVLIPSPRLWWPNGLGEHPLYTVTVQLVDHAGTVQDTYACRVGLRTITVSTQPDQWGSEFAFVVNGVKIFAMGANYVPEDNLLPRVTPERSRRLIADCAAAHFNCLRIWGGGYYPDEALYDACDEYGILVWQDLMFACNVYALNDHFEENIVAETRDIARRLRHHASLALWCSNNEMEWLWADEPVRIRGHHPRYKADYLKIFELILPRALRECDDTTFFWPSSPSSGGAYDTPNCPDRGDQHYWEVWHSGKPFTEYRTHHFRFCSEYGFQSFPHSKTLATFTLPEDRNIFSEVMESHQKNGMANSKIFTYISDYFLYPKDLDSVAYISQVLQLKAIQYGVEHWRRNRGRCMGSLYWQLNDCWPVASWASIDYFGRWKALHYGARHFYAPVTISACEEEELSPRISYWLHNDTLEPRQRRLEVTLLDTDFRVLWQTEGTFTAAPLSAVNCIQADFSPWLQQPGSRNHLVARCRMYEGDRLLEERTTLFVKPKHFRYGTPVYNVSARETDDAFLFTVKSDRFCQYTELCFTDLDAVFSDNFFDITAPEGVTVSVPKAGLPAGVTADSLLRSLTVRSVADSYALPRE